MSEPLVLDGVGRSYQSGETRLVVLAEARLALRAGEIVALVAPSGTGKSTLLHLAGLLERPDAGRVLIDGMDAGSLGDPERTRLRRDRIGFVYQFHHLLGEFSALENVVLPQMIAERKRTVALSA
jgi:lipoprotein-releasing system ATP-binding protein